MPDQGSAFKRLYAAMIKNGGNLSKVQADFKDNTGKVKKIKCFVKESFPYFLVTDNYFYVPCYFTKKAIDNFKSKNSGINLVDLKSKVVEIGEWTLEMAKVDSANVFTSYAGIEIRLIVSDFKIVQGPQVALSRYPVNLYRDDEMKTLFQAYHHGQVGNQVNKHNSNDSLPDVQKKGDSVVKFFSGNAGDMLGCFGKSHTSTVDLATIFKSEKGGAALKKLTDAASSGKIKVISKVSTKKTLKPSAKKQSIAQKLCKKTPKAVDAKKSAVRIKSTGKTPGTLKTPTGKSAAQTPTTDRSQFHKMIKYLKQQKQKGGKK